MKRSNALLTNTDLGKHFILTTPTRVTDMRPEDLYDDINYGWRDKSRRMQARRWRKIRHQIA